MLLDFSFLDPKTYKKPNRPCLFCLEEGKPLAKQLQAKLKRHILARHKDHPRVKILLNRKDVEIADAIAGFRREAILRHNQSSIKNGSNDFMREYTRADTVGIPIYCTGCQGFYSKNFKTRHQKLCRSNGGSKMMLSLATEEIPTFDELSDGFKSLLNTMHQDLVSDHIKNDPVILMIGNRFYGSLKRKKDKKLETTKYVRARLRLTARVYLSFLDIYQNQHQISLEDQKNNSSDMFRREVITLLGE